MQQNAGKSAGQIPIWRATLSAASASLVGIGLARFAYTPLLPAIIGARWFTPSQAWHTHNLIANAGTAYAVLALHACGEIPGPLRKTKPPASPP